MQLREYSIVSGLLHLCSHYGILYIEAWQLAVFLVYPKIIAIAMKEELVCLRVNCLL
jgi:hypothetical protein